MRSFWNQSGVGGALLALAALSLSWAVPSAVAQTRVNRSASGAASSGGSSGSSGGSSSATSGGNSMTSTSRSVSFGENGKQVTITEKSGVGITVTITETVNGKPKKTEVQAANAAELARKDPAAHDLYQRHMGNKNAANASAGGKAASAAGGAASGKTSRSGSHRSSSRSAAGGAGGAANAAAGGGAQAGPGGEDAKDLLRKRIRELQQQNADNPQLKALLDEALRELEKAQ